MSDQLTGVQRLELELLEADAELAARARGPVSFVAALAAMVRYCAAEDIRQEHFARHGETLTFQRSHCAAGFAQYPADFGPGSFGHEVLRAAGLVPPTETVEPAADRTAGCAQTPERP